jgi:hypothetical protein
MVCQRYNALLCPKCAPGETCLGGCGCDQSGCLLTCPNLALSAARIKSQAMASSQPPPNAKPFTAAMIGVRTCGARNAGAVSRAGLGLWGCRCRVRHPVAGGS